MAHYGIKTGATSTYEELKANTLPPKQYGSDSSGKTNYLFEKFTFTNIYQDSVSLSGLLNPYADASWRKPVKTNFYQGKSDGTYQQYDCVRKGYMPLFRSGNVLSSVLSMWTNKKPIHISNGGVQSDLTLTRTITQLKIGSTTLKTSDFVDGVIPVYVGFLVVGSGAGGGCSSGTTGNGTGGSGGGAVFGILNIETNSSLKLHYGAGGYGGYRNTNVSDSDGKRFRGGFGETSYVCPSNNTSVSSRMFSGGGGSPGNTSEYSGNSTSAGQPSYTTAVILPQTQRGGMGGGKGKAGGGTSAITFKMTAATLNTKAPDASGRLDMTCPARSGGTSGNSATGGGGASILGNGGNGGKTAENGKNGDSGAGGGGGRWTFGSWKEGGAGGDGFIMIFY